MGGTREQPVQAAKLLRKRKHSSKGSSSKSYSAAVKERHVTPKKHERAIEQSGRDNTQNEEAHNNNNDDNRAMVLVRPIIHQETLLGSSSQACEIHPNGALNTMPASTMGNSYGPMYNETVYHTMDFDNHDKEDISQDNTMVDETTPGQRRDRRVQYEPSLETLYQQTSPQLQRWVNETSDDNITFTEKLLKYEWEVVMEIGERTSDLEYDYGKAPL